MLIENEVFSFHTGQATDVGLVREHNEDSHLSRPDFGIWVVADGMGGHEAGDFASQTIVEEMGSVGVASSAQDLQARFLERLARAHARIQAHSVALGKGAVGATVVGLLAFEDAFACIWAGDSRIYLLREDTLHLQTIDHTEVQQLLVAGAITKDEADAWPRKNVITRAVGVSETPNCDVTSGTLQHGDTFLLCSDGLTEHISDEEIAEQMQAADPQAICNGLIALTLERGARDNVTTIAVRCHDRSMGG